MADGGHIEVQPVDEDRYAVQPATHKEPIKPSDLPNGPWQQVEMDFQGPYPNGEYIFVMIDQYSQWPEIKILKKAPNHKQQ